MCEVLKGKAPRSQFSRASPAFSGVLYSAYTSHRPMLYQLSYAHLRIASVYDMSFHLSSGGTAAVRPFRRAMAFARKVVVRGYTAFPHSIATPPTTTAAN